MKRLVLLLLVVVLVSGCIDTTTQPSVGKPNIQISPPYSPGFNTISLFVDTNISVPINNPRNENVLVEIIEAKIRMKNKDATESSISGYGNSIEIQGKTSSNLTLQFKNIPIKYELKTSPLVLESEIEEYDVSVKYLGAVKIFGLVPYTAEGTYNQTISIQNISLDENMFFKKILL